MVTLFLSAIFLVTLVSFFGYGSFQFITNFQPSKKKIASDMDKMKEEIKDWTANLVPWNREEMELLSFAQIHKKVKKGMAKSARGVFTSIYHEPLLAYNYKQYISRGNNALLIAQTSKHEFAYRIKKDGIYINIDSEFAGVLKEGGRFYGGPKERLIARINRDEEKKLHPVVIGEKEVASLVNPKHASVPNPRAFKFVAPMKAEEEKIFMSLAVLEIITESF